MEVLFDCFSEQAFATNNCLWPRMTIGNSANPVKRGVRPSAPALSVAGRLHPEELFV